MSVRIRLGGGIGAGKSSVAALLERRGAVVISADDAGRDVLRPGTPETAAVLEKWPDTRAPDGAIDRSALGRLAFADPAVLAELEAITHPGIAARVRESVDRSDAPLVVIEVPILRDMFGHGWPWAVVDAPEEVRISRVASRSGMTEADIRDVMARQPTRAEWLLAARWVIDNSGDLDDLAEECERLWDALVGGPVSS